MAKSDAWLAAVITPLSETERQFLLLAARLMDHLAGALGPLGK
jgi:hypothetical protein